MVKQERQAQASLAASGGGRGGQGARQVVTICIGKQEVLYQPVMQTWRQLPVEIAVCCYLCLRWKLLIAPLFCVLCFWLQLFWQLADEASTARSSQPAVSSIIMIHAVPGLDRDVRMLAFADWLNLVSLCLLH